jgi:hypothetical protein
MGNTHSPVSEKALFAKLLSKFTTLKGLGVLFFLFTKKTSFSGGKQIGLRHGAEAHLPDQRSRQTQGKTHII